MYACTHIYVYIYVCISVPRHRYVCNIYVYIYIDISVLRHIYTYTNQGAEIWGGVATTSRLLKIIGLFCKRAI